MLKRLTSTISIARSYLFVPGDRPDRFDKAILSGSDCIILDLEDAVAPNNKDAARDHVSKWFAAGGIGIIRINPMGTPWFNADLSACEAAPSAAVMIPKSKPEIVKFVARRLPERPLLALLESVEGLMMLRETVSIPNVVRFAFGNIDFGIDARIPGVGRELDYVRTLITLESRFGNLPPPIDGVTTSLDGNNELAEHVARAKSFGFSAKLCIHPKQVPCVNKAFLPSPDEIRWARRIIEAADRNVQGAFSVDGKMVDRPVINRAWAILAQLPD